MVPPSALLATVWLLFAAATRQRAALLSYSLCTEEHVDRGPEFDWDEYKLYKKKLQSENVEFQFGVVLHL